MSEKYILILKGSPRKKGNSSILADQVAAGATQAGADVESFTLQKMNIHPCKGCDACHKSEASECTTRDDMAILFPKLRSADCIVLASPVYWFTLSAQIKACIDRWYSLETPRGSALAGKQFALVLAYGDTDPYTSGGVNAIRTFQDICRYLRAHVAGIIYGSAGDASVIEQQPELLEKAYKLGQKLGSAN
jgi:multimeric flavodoxin WrbA